MRLAVIFSGQGAQGNKHFEELKNAIPPFSLTANLVKQVSGLSSSSLWMENTVAQPLIAAWQLFRWSRLITELPQPVLIAGYSAGETAALAAAGVCGVEDAYGIACRRAELMNQAIAPLGECVMAAVELSAAEDWAEVAHTWGVYPAIVLSVGRVIVGGQKSAVLAYEKRVLARGGECRLLPIHVPSHTALMQSVYQPLYDCLLTLNMAAPKIPLLCSGVVRVCASLEEVQQSFCRQVCHTLEWQQCLSVIEEYRPDVVLEIGPGNTLAKMVRDHQPQIMARSLDEFHNEEAVMDWLERWSD